MHSLIVSTFALCFFVCESVVCNDGILGGGFSLQVIIVLVSFPGICCDKGYNLQFGGYNLVLGELLMFCMIY